MMMEVGEGLGNHDGGRGGAGLPPEIFFHS